MDEDQEIASIDENAYREVRGKIEKWLDGNKWPVPGWWQKASLETTIDKKKDYHDYFVQSLRNRYMVVESDFRTILPLYIRTPERLISDIPSVEMIYQLLRTIREVLEGEKVDPISTSEQLDFLERFIIWIYPQHLLKTRIVALKSNIELMQLNDKELYRQELADLMKDPILEDYSVNDQIFDKIKLSSIRSILDELIGACNKKTLDDMISAGLQIRRLEALRLWGVVLLGVFFLSTPLMVKPDNLSNWIDKSWPIDTYAIIWLSSFAVMVVGTIGGFLSSLISARGSSTSLGKYQEDLLKLQLRPLVGGFVSLIVFVLLSWDIIQGVTVRNLGSFLLIAFVSGFSERFFLRLLDLNEEPN